MSKNTPATWDDAVFGMALPYERNGSGRLSWAMYDRDPEGKEIVRLISWARRSTNLVCVVGGPMPADEFERKYTQLHLMADELQRRYPECPRGWRPEVQQP